MDWKLVHLYDIEENVKFKEIPFESAAEPLLSLVVLSLFFIESQQVIDQISQQRQVFFIQTILRKVERWRLCRINPVIMNGFPFPKHI